jgi:glucose-1-phosphate thymidylyltransferase
MKKTKGIILAGGSGSRLQPLTSIVSKQLLPVYDKPMIHYPVSLLLQCGIREILIIVSSDIQIPLFLKALDLLKVKANFTFIVQDKPLGLAHAFILGENFIGEDHVCLVLGDNIFYGSGINTIVDASRNFDNAIFGIPVKNPESYGVMRFEENTHNYFNYEKLVEIVEKPTTFVSNYAVPGIYFFDNSVSSRAKQVRPSARGELEIVDVINSYIKEDKLFYDYMPSDTVWFDCGTHERLLEASNFVHAIQNRTTQIVGNIYI